MIVKVNGSAVNDCSDFTRLLKGHAENKATVTVLRDRKEQNITITLPEAKKSGEGSTESKCEEEDNEGCVSMSEDDAEIAVLPEMVTAELQRIQPELEKVKKEYQVEVMNHQVEIKKEMEKVQKDLVKQQKELKIEIKQWIRDADI